MQVGREGGRAGASVARFRSVLIGAAALAAFASPLRAAEVNAPPRPPQPEGQALGAPAVEPGMLPFVVDHEQRKDGPADVRFLLDGPAGKYGHVLVKDGHLAFPNGKRFRCWGVNLTGWTPGAEEIPGHEAARTFAAELARLGVNCVRMHFLDMPNHTSWAPQIGPTGDPEPLTHRPRGLIDSTRPDTGHFDPVQLEHLDYFFAQLKGRGIYVDLNLNVGHTWKSGDGIPDAELIGVAKGETYFGPELIAREKDYARQLLDHRNPYTGLRYADDPAVAMVELVNENSLLEFWMRNWIRGELKPGAPRHQLDFTPHYKALLTKQYNDWLKANRTPAELARIRQEAGVGPGEPVPMMRRQEFDAAPKARFYAEAAFLTDTEGKFLLGMRDFLKKDLGVKALVMPTADHTLQMPGQPLLRTTQKFAINDGHVYWQHPAIYGLRNTPMVDDPLHSILQKVSRTALLNHPFTVSEVNEPFPNEYDSEQVPLLAAYAALQDWDGIFFYTFESKTPGEWTPYVEDHFNISEHPTKIAQLPVGAMIFLRGDVHAAKEIVTRSYSTDQVYEQMRMPMSAMPAFTPGYPAALPLRHETRIACLDCAATSAPAEDPAPPYVSDTGEITWRVRPREHAGDHGADHGGTDGLVSIDTDKTQALIGFIPANNVGTTNFSADISNPFATITLSSLDGKPISKSNHLLLTACGKVANSGAVWNPRRTLYAKWGTAPTMIEPIKGWIQLKDLTGIIDLKVTPLDGSSRPLQPVEARLLEYGWEFPIGTQAADSYLIDVVR